MKYSMIISIYSLFYEMKINHIPWTILNILLTPIVYEHAYASKKMSKMYTDEARKAITQLATGGG